MIVTWGIDSLDSLPLAGKRVISVHHADMSSEWSHSLQRQKAISDVVCVNETVADWLRGQLSIPVHFIPNAVALPKPSESTMFERDKNRRSENRIVARIDGALKSSQSWPCA